MSAALKRNESRGGSSKFNFLGFNNTQEMLIAVRGVLHKDGAMWCRSSRVRFISTAVNVDSREKGWKPTMATAGDVPEFATTWRWFIESSCPPFQSEHGNCQIWSLVACT